MVDWYFPEIKIWEQKQITLFMLKLCIDAVFGGFKNLEIFYAVTVNCVWIVVSHLSTTSM